MRIGLVGNCQTSVIARWLEHMLPEHDIVHHGLAQPADALEAAGEDLAHCDVILSQMIGAGAGSLETARLRRRGPPIVIVPTLIFTGFQPDMAYLYRRDGSTISSPIGAYHSRIAIACFHAGLGPIRTRALFNSHVYALLGFFAEYAKARSNLEEVLSQGGFSTDIDELLAHGAFMHTINHPNAFILRALTAELVGKIGLKPLLDVKEIEDALADDVIWPIYPEVARRAGIANGSMTYLRNRYICGDGEPRGMSLEQLIEGLFEIYAREKENIYFPTVERDAGIIRSAIRRKYDD